MSRSIKSGLIFNDTGNSPVILNEVKWAYIYMVEPVKKQIKKALQELFNLDIDVEVEIPKSKKFGDYSSSVAMKIAKDLKRPPLEIAEIIKNSVKDYKFFEKVQVVKPGFINFYLNDAVLIEKVLSAIFDNSLLPVIARNQKVVVEHTSVNPNKAMHIGHIRNAILGDSISRLLKKLGFCVEVHNYIDDTGVQVADTINGLLSLDLKKPGNQKYDDYCWDIYTQINKSYETNPSLLENRKKILHAIELGNSEISEIAKGVVDKIVSCHLDLMNEFNINYDLLVFEKDIIGFGFWDSTFEKLKESPNFVFVNEGEQKGCWVLKYNDAKFEDKIFVRADGTKVYTAKDTAYHLWKFGLLDKDFLYKKWLIINGLYDTWSTDAEGIKKDTFGHADMVINVIDERQSYPQETVKEALYSLGFKKQAESFKHIAYGVVSLSKKTADKLGLDTSDGKNSYTMSGRKGIGVKVTELVSLLEYQISKLVRNEDSSTSAAKRATAREVAIGAIKHYMLKNDPDSEVIFDFEQALQLVGNTGPYLQYSHARASSILRHAGDFELSVSFDGKVSDTERSLVSKLAEFPKVMNTTLKDFNISRLSNYAFELSSAFHSFYENNNVLKSSSKVKLFRLTLVKAYKITISNVLDILGITSPDQM